MEESVPARGKNKWKTPEKEIHLEFLKYRKEARVAAAD